MVLSVARRPLQPLREHCKPRVYCHLVALCPQPPLLPALAMTPRSQLCRPASASWRTRTTCLPMHMMRPHSRRSGSCSPLRMRLATRCWHGVVRLPRVVAIPALRLVRQLLGLYCLVLRLSARCPVHQERSAVERRLLVPLLPPSVPYQRRGRQLRRSRSLPVVYLARWPMRQALPPPLSRAAATGPMERRRRRHTRMPALSAQRSARADLDSVTSVTRLSLIPRCATGLHAFPQVDCR